MALCPSAYSQQQTTTKPAARDFSGPVVREIAVEYAGPKTVSKTVILSNMRTTVGQPFSKEAVEDDVRNLYATGFFTNLRIYDEPLRDGVKVVVIVQGKPLVREVVIKGISAISEKAIRKAVKTTPGSTLDEKQIAADGLAIVELYQKKGFPKARADYKIDTNDQTGRSMVTFNISEGGKYVIEGIHFRGLKVLQEKKLLKQMKTKKDNIFSFFTQAGRLKEEQFQDDIKKVIQYAQNEGFIDAEIKNVEYKYTDKNRVEIFMDMFEGIQYKVGSVVIQNASIFKAEELRKKLLMTEGKVFSPKGLEEDKKAIEDTYGTVGYIDTRAIPVRTPNIQSGTIDIVYQMQEGLQSYVNKIKVQGNDRTKDKVIRRELAVKPGEIYDTVKVEASRDRLKNLGYFSKVEITPEDTNVPDRKNIVIQVEEQRTGSLTFGAGFSSVDSILGFVEVSQGNFDLFNFPAFTGAGQKARMRIQYGAKRQDVDLSFREPYFLDKELALQFNAFYRTATYFSKQYDQSNAGFSTKFEKRLGEFFRGELGYKLEQIDIFNVSDSASSVIKEEAGDRLKSSVFGSIVRDTRDNVFLTHSGNKTELYGEVAGGPLMGDTHTWKATLESSQYFEVFKDNIILIHGSTGITDFYGKGKRVPIFDRFFLGGANSLRGFDYRDVGPRDSEGEPIGGRTYLNGTVEYTFPIIDRVRGAVFYDAGFVSAKPFDWNYGSYNSDVGVGLRLNLPIGPIRLDYGVPLATDDDNGSNGKFHFNVGYQF